MRGFGLLALAWLMTSCGVIADAEQLADSSWVVVEIDGEAVPSDEIYLFFDSLDSASLVTHIVFRGGGRALRCREGTSDVAMDTDGHALNFTGFEENPLSGPEREPCGAELMDLHDRIAQALRENESWEATADTLELIGTSRVRLEQSGRDYN